MTEVEKLMLDAQGLLEVLRYHWLGDSNAFAAELQRVKLAIFLLIVTSFEGRKFEQTMPVQKTRLLRPSFDVVVSVARSV